ncbi:hypothetical protein [Altericista sp. CCNU0014]|uniref:hypothetical protein n=1 Tax=Altericista sp. CCNU0014 TaxID=3082949 RepID=UPI00384D9E15
MLLLRSIAVWLVFIAVESLNGTIRNVWLTPSLGDVWAYRISFVTGAFVVLAIATLFIRWLRAVRVFQLLGVGVLWVALTLAFELVLGRVVLGYSWAQIAADYNVRQGGLMFFGLVWLGLSPLISAKIRGAI